MTRRPSSDQSGRVQSSQTITTQQDGSSLRLTGGSDRFSNDNEVAIAVMGATGSGKTTFINLASGSKLRVGKGLQSCTSSVQTSAPFEIGGRMVTLIDTPGFDDTTRSDTDILKMIAQFLAVTYERGRTLHGVIYMHRISDFRMGGISRRNFVMFRQLCGDTSLKNVLIGTSMWGEVSPDVGAAREAELAREDMFFKPVLDKGAILVRNENTRESALALLHHILNNHPLPLRIQRELVEEGKNIIQTAAGAELNRELLEEARKHKQELRELQEEMKAAIKAKDDETRKELEQEQRRLQKEMEKIQTDAQKLASNYSQEREKLEKKMQQMEEDARRQARAAEGEYKRQMKTLQDRFDQTAQASNEEKESLRRQMDDLRNNYHHPRSGGGGWFSMVGRAIDSFFGLL